MYADVIRYLYAWQKLFIGNIHKLALTNVSSALKSQQFMGKNVFLIVTGQQIWEDSVP